MYDPECRSVITEQPTQEDYKEGLKKRQIVMEFDMTTWKVRKGALIF